MNSTVCIALLLFAVVALAAVARVDGFVIDEDLVEELTKKRVHIRLYDEFYEKNGRRPDQGEYERMIADYQTRFRDTGIHPRIEDVVPGPAGRTAAEKAAFWAFYAILGLGFVFVIALVAVVLARSRRLDYGRRPDLFA